MPTEETRMERLRKALSHGFGALPQSARPIVAEMLLQVAHDLSSPVGACSIESFMLAGAVQELAPAEDSSAADAASDDGDDLAEHLGMIAANLAMACESAADLLEVMREVAAPCLAESPGGERAA